MDDTINGAQHAPFLRPMEDLLLQVRRRQLAGLTVRVLPHAMHPPDEDECYKEVMTEVLLNVPGAFVGRHRLRPGRHRA